MAELLHIAGIEGLDKEVKLIAGVIDIKFALHLIARSLEHVGQCVAQHSVTCTTVVDGAGRIGADIFYLPAWP